MYRSGPRELPGRRTSARSSPKTPSGGRLPSSQARATAARLLAAPDRGDIWERHFHGKAERDRLLLALFAYAGLRRSELLGLAWDDVDLFRRLLYVRKAKGGRQRVVPIHPALAPLFAAYYATRVPLVEQALFLSVQGKPINYTQLGQVFRHYVASSGVGERKRVTPHTLRHVFASELLRAGGTGQGSGGFVVLVVDSQFACAVACSMSSSATPLLARRRVDLHQRIVIHNPAGRTSSNPL